MASTHPPVPPTPAFLAGERGEGFHRDVLFSPYMFTAA